MGEVRPLNGKIFQIKGGRHRIHYNISSSCFYFADYLPNRPPGSHYSNRYTRFSLTPRLTHFLRQSLAKRKASLVVPSRPEDKDLPVDHINATQAKQIKNRASLFEINTTSFEM